MKELSCDHPRQKGREFNIPGATPEEAERDVDCAVPGCPAGHPAPMDGLIVLAEPPDVDQRPNSNRERQTMVYLERVVVAGVYRWRLDLKSALEGMRRRFLELGWTDVDIELPDSGRIGITGRFGGEGYELVFVWPTEPVLQEAIRKQLLEASERCGVTIAKRRNGCKHERQRWSDFVAGGVEPLQFERDNIVPCAEPDCPDGCLEGGELPETLRDPRTILRWTRRGTPGGHFWTMERPGSQP